MGHILRAPAHRSFTGMGFMAPYCVVRDNETGQKGSVKFQANPRFYFSFQPE